MLAKVISAAVNGIDAYVVTVEIDISPGLPTFSIVGLPDAAGKESKDKGVSAIRNSGFDFPARRVTVNLAPGDIKKEGVAFDLPIALGILTATEQLNKEAVDRICFVGELSLDGIIRPVKGVLPISIGIRNSGFKYFVVPKQNAREASAARGAEIIPCENLRGVVDFLQGSVAVKPEDFFDGIEEEVCLGSLQEIDFADIKGQFFAKRALEVAACGERNMVMNGPPGSGKTMLAKRIGSILPPLSVDESLETTKIHSVAGFLQKGGELVTQRVFRSPHHTVSDAALIGGGTYPKPGEVSLAHNGVLFLDELPEFHRDVLEVLRQPLEDHCVTIARAKHTLIFPASFMLVAAMNPCPCGSYGHPEKECLCTPYQIKKYRSKISGPLMDRIDIHLEVPALKISELSADECIAETSATVRKRVQSARGRQRERFAGTGIRSNSRMNSRQVRKFCAINKESKELIAGAVKKLGLSARAYDKILKVSRTIADLENSENIETEHVAEAVNYRSMDRF